MTKTNLPSNLLLAGMSGVGKSTIARILARRMNWEFVDLDQWIEEQQGVNVATIFAQAGEAHFRDLESRAIRAMSDANHTVIALGGGALCANGNVDLARKVGKLVYIKATVEAIASRVRHSQNERPLLRGLEPDEVHAKLKTMLVDRSSAYEQCDHTILSDGKRPEQVATEIQRWYESVMSAEEDE